MKVSFDSMRPWIKLSGERTFVQPAVTFFKSLADALYTDTLIIKKAGAKEYFMEQGKIMLSMFVNEDGFVVVLQEDDMLKEENDDFSQGPLGRVSRSCLKVYILQIGHLTLEVSSGDITKEKTDAIVNSLNQTFSFKSGQGGANPANVADAMINAVIEFVIKNEPVHVKSVEFIIFQTSMLNDFHENMLKRTMKSKTGKINRTKGKKILFDEIEPVMFQLCGETPADLSKASALINSLINQEHINITIHDPAIAHFTKEDLEMMSKMEKELKVSVITGKKGQDSVITLKGLTGFVQTAESRIRDIIRKVERNEHRKILAALTSSIVEWQYKSGHNFKAFDIFTNCDLEEAFKLQTTSVQIRIDSEMYNADIVRKIATKGRKRTELKRVELKAAAQSFLPSNWEDMKGQSVVLVKLTAGSKEYADVEKEFKKTGLSSNIIKIERVQNSALWRYYIIKKEQLEEKNQHKNNEKCLFHGTGPDTTDQINNHGFNRSFAGMHGVSKAILDGAGSQVEKELSKMAKDTNDEETEIVTSSGNLPCKKIIHIVGCNSPDDIQEKVLSALMLCENHKFSSVAFPALGTGEGEVEPAKAADAMITAVVEFASKKTNYVKNVEFLIFQSTQTLPLHWEDMKGQSVVLVKVTAGSEEFTDVEKEFRKTGQSNNIIKIERVQNSALWKNYMIKKEITASIAALLA
ncbi:poly [ADP-ribose] polymerase 14-like protein [Labeo rohita]|uniref:Poly [ADP-ribose] polymerase 14-like protein n=1 Tax=Labeo rohita TaxID=84645 RepID=A0A498LSZ8_LABRO|nr:poly [ADP-ribose] polymerase 14-like protein [Labeo rohita]